MVLVQVRLLSLYLRLRFTPGFWRSRSRCAVALRVLDWLAFTHPGSQRTLARLVCSAVTVLVAAIAVRTLVALVRGELIVPAPRASSERQRPPRTRCRGGAMTRRRKRCSCSYRYVAVSLGLA